jgi:hypothetical protein
VAARTVTMCAGVFCPMSPTLSSCYDASSGPWSIVGEDTDAIWGFALL